MNLIIAGTLVVIGLIAGFFSGFYGLGGGILLIPAMIYLLGLNQQTAQGTSIAIMLLPVGIFAFINYYKAGHVNILFALVIAVTFMIGSYCGSKISLSISEILMRKIFGLILLLSAIKMIISK